MNAKNGLIIIFFLLSASAHANVCDSPQKNNEIKNLLFKNYKAPPGCRYFYRTENFDFPLLSNYSVYNQYIKRDLYCFGDVINFDSPVLTNGGDVVILAGSINIGANIDTRVYRDLSIFDPFTPDGYTDWLSARSPACDPNFFHAPINGEKIRDAVTSYYQECFDCIEFDGHNYSPRLYDGIVAPNLAGAGRSFEGFSRPGYNAPGHLENDTSNTSDKGWIASYRRAHTSGDVRIWVGGLSWEENVPSEPPAWGCPIANVEAKSTSRIISSGAYGGRGGLGSLVTVSGGFSEEYHSRQGFHGFGGDGGDVQITRYVSKSPSEEGLLDVQGLADVSAGKEQNPQFNSFLNFETRSLCDFYSKPFPSAPVPFQAAVPTSTSGKLEYRSILKVGAMKEFLDQLYATTISTGRAYDPYLQYEIDPSQPPYTTPIMFLETRLLAGLSDRVSSHLETAIRQPLRQDGEITENLLGDFLNGLGFAKAIDAAVEADLVVALRLADELDSGFQPGSVPAISLEDLRLIGGIDVEQIGLGLRQIALTQGQLVDILHQIRDTQLVFLSNLSFEKFQAEKAEIEVQLGKTLTLIARVQNIIESFEQKETDFDNVKKVIEVVKVVYGLYSGLEPFYTALSSASDIPSFYHAIGEGLSLASSVNSALDLIDTVVDIDPVDDLKSAQIALVELRYQAGILLKRLDAIKRSMHPRSTEYRASSKRILMRLLGMEVTSK